MSQASRSNQMLDLYKLLNEKIGDNPSLKNLIEILNSLI
jgi:hypothetical protein